MAVRFKNGYVEVVGKKGQILKKFKRSVHPSKKYASKKKISVSDKGVKSLRVLAREKRREEALERWKKRYPERKSKKRTKGGWIWG